MIPIVSREQVEGFLCTHTKMKSEEVNKRVYLSVHILSFVFEYYRLIEQAKGSGVIDPITGLYNERHFHLQASMDIQKVERFKKPLTSVGIKIKGFDDIVSKSGDRKSTRLNSSHVAISYAVFCLKKKIGKQEFDLQ